MTFSESIAVCFSKYGTFKGRASRSEFWWFYLFTILVSWGALLVDPTEIISTIFGLIIIVPWLAVSARRLHDRNLSGWWQLLSLTIIGILLLIIWWTQDGLKADNEHGKSLRTETPDNH